MEFPFHYPNKKLRKLVTLALYPNRRYIFLGGFADARAEAAVPQRISRLPALLQRPVSPRRPRRPLQMQAEKCPRNCSQQGGAR